MGIAQQCQWPYQLAIEAVAAGVEFVDPPLEPARGFIVLAGGDLLLDLGKRIGGITEDLADGGHPVDWRIAIRITDRIADRIAERITDRIADRIAERITDRITGRVAIAGGGRRDLCRLG
ncbi:MAG: hypothetical protein ACNA7W_20245 [Pseudomonadales bacterium]